MYSTEREINTRGAVRVGGRMTLVHINIFHEMIGTGRQIHLPEIKELIIDPPLRPVEVI